MFESDCVSGDSHAADGEYFKDLGTLKDKRLCFHGIFDCWDSMR